MRTRLFFSLALLSAAGPLAVDLYLPGLPQMAAELSTTGPLVQFTLTGILVGMGLGQLCTGVLSDTYGRKPFLVAGAGLALLACIVCALAPTIGVLIAARLLQGAGCGACVVLARSVVPDLMAGKAAARAFTMLMVITGLAPILAPLVGGIALPLVGWRGLFWLLAGICLIQLLLALYAVPETRPPGTRTPLSVSSFAVVATNKIFLGYLVSFSLGFATLFSYISASPFVIQEEMGAGVQTYGVIFAINGTGMMAAGLLNRWLIDRFELAAVVRTAHLIQVTGALTCLGAALLGSAPVLLVGLFATVSTNGLLMGNIATLAVGKVRARAGTASALMGFTQFVCAGIVSPLATNMLAMSIALTVAAGIATLMFRITARADQRPQSS